MLDREKGENGWIKQVRIVESLEKHWKQDIKKRNLTFQWKKDIKLYDQLKRIN